MTSTLLQKVGPVHPMIDAHASLYFVTTDSKRTYLFFIVFFI